MTSLNHVTVMGKLTREPELRQIGNGATVGKMALALNRRITTPQGEGRDEVCFVDVEVWGKQAQVCGQFLQKGSTALVEGHLRFEQWQDKQTGKNRHRLLVRADRVHFMDAQGPSRGEGPDGYDGPGVARRAGGGEKAAPASAPRPL